MYTRKISNIRGKTKNKFEGPFKIRKIFEDNTAEIEKDDKIQRVHLRLLRKPNITDGAHSQEKMPISSTSTAQS